MSWKSIVRWVGRIVAILVVLAAVVVAFALLRFNRVTARAFDVAPLPVTASSDSAVIARGRHLAESIGGCFGCHGEGLGGSLPETFGPIGTMSPPNLTTGRGGVGANYTDGELARAIKFGIGSDGRTLLFMPSQEHNWWPESDLVAVVSFVRSVPPVDNEVAPSEIGTLGKILTQFGVMEFRSALNVNPEAEPESVPAPEPTARYGEFLARGCAGCHGERLSGGKIPGAPASLPIPANLTPHESGLGNWTEEDFVNLLNTGTRPDGRQLDPFMPVATTRRMNETEKRALWAYLRSLEPVEFGNR